MWVEVGVGGVGCVAVVVGVLTAFASSVLPVPGGPNRSTPFQGSRIPAEQTRTEQNRVQQNHDIKITINGKVSRF